MIRRFLFLNLQFFNELGKGIDRCHEIILHHLVGEITVRTDFSGSRDIEIITKTDAITGPIIFRILFKIDRGIIYPPSVKIVDCSAASQDNSSPAVVVTCLLSLLLKDR